MKFFAQRALAATLLTVATATLALGGAMSASAAEPLTFNSNTSNNSYYYPSVCSVSPFTAYGNRALVTQCPPNYGFQSYKFAYTSTDYGLNPVDHVAQCNVPANGMNQYFPVNQLPGEPNSDSYTSRYEIIPLYQGAVSCPTG